MKTIKIVSINTWKGEGDYSLRMEHMLDELAALNPDIVLCQECFKSEEIEYDTALMLATHLKMYFNYVPARNKKRQCNGAWILSESGLAILSKFEMGHCKTLVLPMVPGDGSRLVQQVEIKMPQGQRFLIWNTHLTHIETRENYRFHQINHLTTSLANQPELPYFIGGDFNAVPDSMEIEYLKIRGGLNDCFSFFHANNSRHSLVEPFKLGMNNCVDYIFCPARFINDQSILIEQASIVLNKKNSQTGNYPSDHFGMQVTAKIPD
jgi:endonuclease/exonuclease/phosphatase family metal-dependent hydrolase